MSKENLITNSNVFIIRVKSDGIGYKPLRIVENLFKELNKLD